MSDPFLSEIRMFGFGFAPRGWAACGGQIMAIAQNQALFSLLGTTYGGDGVTTFALPNLQGRAPLHFNASHQLGQSTGEIAHTLTPTELPAHNHVVQASSVAATVPIPVGNTLAAQPIYGPPTNLVPMNSATLQATGGGQPHPNMQPSLSLNFCVALQGIYPSRN
jgi:microcystin-dependent protein